MANTVIVKEQSPGSVKTAADYLHNGGIVIIPTETVYGIAIDPSNQGAVKRLGEIKKRDAGKPLARFIASVEQIDTLKPLLKKQVKKTARIFFPGPLTLVIESESGEKTGIRMPDNQCAHAITSRLSFLPAVTSANIAGSHPLLKIQDIINTFSGKVDCIIDSGDIHGKASTVVEFGSQGIHLLRSGPVDFPELLEAATVTFLFVCSGNICRSATAHYLFTEKLKKKFSTHTISRFGFRVISAGTYRINGNTPPLELIEILGKDNIDISKHRSQGLTEELLEHADIVYAMDETHMDFIRENHPDFMQKTRKLGCNGADIEDPYMGTREIYRKSVSRINESLEEVVKEL